MKYPKHLLPSKEYFGRIAAEDIPRGACFIRWTAGNLPVKTIQGLRKNAAKHIDKGCIYNGISCYLCSVMKKKDTQYILAIPAGTKYFDAWNEGEEPIMPDDADVTIRKHRGCFCMKAESIKAFRSKITFNTKDNVSRVEDATLRFEHAPTYTNYWHFDLHVWSCPQDKSKEPYKLREHIEGNSENAKSRKFRKYMVGIMEDIGSIMTTEKSIKPVYLTKSKYIK